jgi:hypothetical protein
MSLTKVSYSMIQGAPINVLDFGAIGNGVADDTAAFQAAFAYLESVGGGVIKLAPDCNFALLTWTVVATTTPIQVEGQGSKITGPVSGLGVCFKPSNSFVFNNIVFERWATVFIRELADAGTIQNARIENNTFLNVTIPINFECPCQNLNIIGNTITGGAGQFGIRIGTNDKTLETGWTRIRISNNTITDRTTTGVTGNYPILSYSEHSIISNNIIRNIRSENAECFGIYVKVRYSSLYGNIIDDIRSTGSSGAFLDCVGIDIKGDVRGGVSVSPGGAKNTCIGNTVKRIGVQLSHGSGIKCQTEENTISNNAIEDVGGVGIDANDFGAIGSIISSNTITGFNILGNYGIWVSGISDGVIVSSNQIINFKEGVRLDGGATPCTAANVTNNFIKSTIANSYAIRLASGIVRECSISNNTVDFSGAGSVVILTDSANHVNLTVQNNNFQIPSAAGFALFNTSPGAGLRVTSNRGYKSQSGALATVPAAGLVINHGLYTTPQAVVATMFNNTIDRATASTFTSTQFTLSHSAGADQGVSWLAWVDTNNE